MFKPYTLQTAFDAVCARLKDGNGQAMSPSGQSCIYITPDCANRCAVGALLTERQAIEANRGGPIGQMSVRDIMKAFPKRWQGDEHIMGDLLSRLQRAHDHSGNWEGNQFMNWDKMWTIASDFGLDASAANVI